MILRCQFGGKPCKYFCTGRAAKLCVWRNDDVLEKIAEAVEESHAQDSKALQPTDEEA